MIRQWVTIGVLGVMLTALSWNFVDKVILYDPLSGLGGITNSPSIKPEAQKKFKAAWGKDITKKNLFASTRNFDPEAKPQNISSSMNDIIKPNISRPLISLNGIIKNQYGEHVAYIQLNNMPTATVRRGDMLEGVKVISIENRKIELMWEDEIFTIELPKSSLGR